MSRDARCRLPLDNVLGKVSAMHERRSEAGNMHDADGR